MATHSSTLAWKIPWVEEPGGLQSMGSRRVGHDWATHFHFSLSSLEKEMATHSSVLAWRIPGTGEPGGLPSMGLHRVGYDWSDLAAAAAAACYVAKNSKSLLGNISNKYKSRQDRTGTLVYLFCRFNNYQPVSLTLSPTKTTLAL